MPVERQKLGESASVQITPAPAAPADPNASPPPAIPAPQEGTPAVTPNKNPIQKLAGLFGALMSLVLLASIACTPTTAPLHADRGGLDDGASVQAFARPAGLPAGVPFLHTSDDTNPGADRWRAHIDVAKCFGEVAVCTAGQAYEVVSAEHNLLLTAGAGANGLWGGLSTAGLATPFNTTNTQLAVGDGTTAPAVGNTDLAAIGGTKLNAADITSCTNATPVVCAGSYSPTPLVGQVVVFSAFTGAGSAVLNTNWELSAASASSITLLNSASPGAITVTGGLIKPINYYRQQANAAGSAVITTNQIVYVATFGTTNANFAWNEWGTSTGAAATNKQTATPPTLLNRATPGGGLGTKTSAASWTLTVTLSLS
jgi:hypothetical protein